jgi:phage baseplate assembly protein W
MADPMKTDLRLIFGGAGADISWSGGELETVAGRDNLAQALTLRLIIHRGDLAQLGHPRYGSKVKELLGEPLDRTNLELLRRYVRQALKEDPRVEEVTSVVATARASAPGVVDVAATVKAISGETVQVELALDLE